MSLRGEILRLGLRLFMKRHSQPFDLAAWRENMRAMERFVPRAPRSARTELVVAGPLRFHRITTPRTREERHVLYLHGGAYISGAPVYYRHFLWRLADAAKANIWALEYRLAPEHRFPAALQDACAAYSWLEESAPRAEQLLVMGDSAGAGLALCLLMKLRDERKALPRAAVAMSPWTDLALTGGSLKENAALDPMLNVDDLPAFVHCYLGDANPRDPYASPLYGDTSGLPPVLLQVGSDEILRDDAVRMADKLRRTNPHSRLEIWPRMPHVFQLFVPVLPEARKAIAQIGAFVDEMAREGPRPD